MLGLREDFETRSQEIYDYLSLIKFLDGVDSEILANNNTTNLVITSSMKKTLKGTIYILLYNLVESTMREAICYIHDDIKSKRICFDELLPSIQKEIIKRVKSEHIGLTDIVSSIRHGISIDIPYASFNKKKLFSGNITRDEINKKSLVYGFSCQSNFEITKHGEKLDIVKQHRNDLAHGNISFSEIGKDKTPSDLLTVCDEVIAYLEAITSNIEEYVRHQKYKPEADE